MIGRPWKCRGREGAWRHGLRHGTSSTKSVAMGINSMSEFECAGTVGLEKQKKYRVTGVDEWLVSSCFYARAASSRQSCSGSFSENACTAPATAIR